MQKALAGIEGISNLKTQRLTYIPQVEVRFKPEMSTGLGLSPGDVRSVTETTLTGTKVGDIYSHQKIHNIVVRGNKRYRTSIDALGEMDVALPGGGVAPGQRCGHLRRTDAKPNYARGWFAQHRRESRRERALAQCGFRRRKRGTCVA